VEDVKRVSNHLASAGFKKTFWSGEESVKSTDQNLAMFMNQ
jgi:hypothetical protein